MKKFRWLLFVSLIVCFLTFFTACASEPMLSRPTGLKIDVENQILTWDGVEGAERYRVQIGTETEDIAETEYNLETMALEPGTYTVQIKAISGNEDVKNSAWSKGVTYIKEANTGLKFKLVDKTYYEVEKIGKASGDIEIPATYRGKPVRSIAAKAFTGKAAVKTVVIGENVKKIGARAFSNCSKLTNVQFPAGLEEIGEYAFQNCRMLTSVTIPDGVKEIKECAFSYCRSMTELTIGAGVEKIGPSAFADCEILETVVIPDNVKSLADRAFSLCDALKTVTIGKGMETIGVEAFYNCDQLTNINFGGTKTIGESAFYGCGAIETVKITDSVKTIANRAFEACEKLNDVTFGKGLSSIGMYAFLDTKLLTDAPSGIVYVDKWLIVNKNTTTNTVTIADDTVGIAAGAFNGNPSFSNLLIPDSVKYIGVQAFSFCASLSIVGMGDGVESIANYAFYACKKLSRIEFDLEKAQLKSIGAYAFQSCESLASINLPSGIERIDKYAFEATPLWTNSAGVVYAGVDGSKWAVGYTGGAKSVAIENGTVGIAEYAFWKAPITDLTIPASVKTIGPNAFNSCENLQSVSILAPKDGTKDLPSLLKQIPDYAFFRCSALEKVELPAGIEKIGRSAFYGCVSLLYMAMPDSVQTIGEFAYYGSAIVLLDFSENSTLQTIERKAFQGCSIFGMAGEIKLPNSLKTIGDYAFYKCEGLKELTIGNGVETIGNYAFSGCIALTKLTLPASVKAVGDYSFRGCTAMTTLSLNEGLKTIGKSAFYGCKGLTYVVLPTTVESLGDYAFRGCEKITGFVLPKTVATMGRHVLYGCKNLTFYCEAESQPEGWNGMWNSLFRPVFWNCTLSEDKSYVVSYKATEEGVFNPLALNGITAPTREGKVLEYWSLSEDLSTNDYSATDVYKAPAGATLYAKWVDAPEPEPEQGGETPAP